MKTTNLKWIAYALSVLMLMQSCVVYHKTPVAIEEAISYNNKVRAKTFAGVTYEFDNLIREEGQLYGITKRNSKTAKKLTQLVVDNNSDDKYVKIAVLENTIKEFNIQNKSLSTILSIAFPVLGIIGVAFLIYDNNDDWGNFSDGGIPF